MHACGNIVVPCQAAAAVQIAARIPISAWVSEAVLGSVNKDNIPVHLVVFSCCFIFADLNQLVMKWKAQELLLQKCNSTMHNSFQVTTAASV